ncbi:MAG TPA: CehA/McbA family metallohydrolase [Propionibacteriaceae bacterium]|nr:CehA/McbA family metallohydrolase [Propionibacteriaceae bacterium]
METFTRTYTLDDQAEDRYRTVPFEVPLHAPSLEVRIAVDDPDAVIDLGCEGPAGWRGWSGANRRTFVIATDTATPGYLPGYLEPGEWHVMLGLHLLPHGRATVTVEVSVPATREPETAPDAAVVEGRRGSERGLPAPAGLRWWATDLHSHTLHSDGTQSIAQLAAWARRSGLDALAVTDHNTVSHHRFLPSISAAHGITLIPGQEVTTHRGHANAYGEIGFIDFRRPAAEWVAEVETRGGLLSANHPTDGDCSWLHDVRTPAVEAFHISWCRNLTATTPWAFLRWWGTHDPVLLGGSDVHDPAQGWNPGTPTTWVLAEECSPDSILAGMKAGRTSLSVGTTPDATVDPFGSPVLLRLDDELVALQASGCVLVDADGRRRTIVGEDVRVKAEWGTGPYRLEDPRRWVVAVTA